jgi:hypothetical protein
VQRPTASIEDLQRRTAELVQQVNARAEAFKGNLERVLGEISDRKKAIENAEQYVDAMLAALRQSVEEGRPDGRLAQEIATMVRLGNELAIQAANENDEFFATRFRRDVERFLTLRSQLEGSYGDALRAIRELEARKRTIARAKQANELEIAYQTLEGAVGQYRSMTQDAQALADAATAASPPRPRQ